jgi:predicted dehydrogenase
MKRIVIVGAGSIGLRHARVCGRFAGLQIEVCDARPEGLREAATALGPVPLWDAFDAVVASAPDFMVIATPHALHSGMACAAMRAGTHVLCEKPMSDSVAGALEIAATARETGRVCRIGFMLRFHPAVVRLRALWISGALGRIVSVRYHAGALETLENSRSRYQATLRGALVMDYVHGLDLITWLCGAEPAGVYARGLHAGGFPHDSDPNIVSAVLDFDAPVLGEVHLDYATKPAVHELQIIGDEATARVALMRGAIELREHGKNLTTEIALPIVRDDLYATQLEHFLAAVDSRPDSACTPAEGVCSTRVMETMLQAIECGQRVALAPQAIHDGVETTAGSR